MSRRVCGSRSGRSLQLAAGRPFSRPLVCALLSLAACSSDIERRARTPRPPLLGNGFDATAAFAAPARFRYHPRERARVRAERALPTGELLLAGERGERWLLDPKTRSLTAAAALAPESLLAVLASKDAFWFVGQSGTTYTAQTPLVAFSRSNAPPEPLVAVSAAGTSIVAVRASRELLRSANFGATWSPVSPAPAAHWVDVALGASGAGLALAVPEALFRTDDFGASWQPLRAASLGALELDVDRAGRVRLVTPLGDRVWQPDTDAFVSLGTGEVGSSLPPPPRGPDAAALAEGRAALNGLRYEEVLRAAERPGWQLWSGTLEQPLQASTLKAAEGCRTLRYAAFGGAALFACFRGSAESASQPVELFKRDELNEPFVRVDGELHGSLAAFRLAVGAGGRWLVSGVCPPAGEPAGCSPGGIQRRRGASEAAPPAAHKARVATSELAAAAVPSLAESALALTFSNDGRVAYAVGRRTKNGRFALFVSQDGGKSFSVEDLSLGQMASSEEENPLAERSPGTRVEAVSAAEDGTLAITFAHYARRTLVVTDERGKLLSSSEVPAERALLGAAGLRAIAVVAKARQVWESLDGGVSWARGAPLPVDVCGPNDACDVPVRCAPQACIIGRELTRRGWGAEPSAPNAPPLPAPRARPRVERTPRTPLACNLEAAPFRTLAGVLEAPSAHDAALGALGWHSVGQDTNRGSVVVYHAQQGKVEPIELLGALTRPEEHALAVLGQVEGVAALRYRIPDGTQGRTSLTQVEVAWDNVLEGRRAVARLPDVGPYVPGDYVRSSGRVQRAQPDLVSIASGGVYLRAHQAARSDQTTWFLDGKQSERVPSIHWPRDDRVPSRPELVRLGKHNVPVSFVGRGAAVVRARPQLTAWTFDAFATGMIDPAPFGLHQMVNIAYLGGRAGLYVEVQDVAGVADSAALFPFRADGAVLDAPVALPTQRSLATTPPVCSAELRTSTPRSVAAAAPGTQHPVIVNDPAEAPRTLLSGFAVLHGRPSAACVAAFDATAVPTEASPAPTRESALLLMNDLEHSVLFRVAGEGETARLEYRHMACRFDPAAEIPPEVYRALGNR